MLGYFQVHFSSQDHEIVFLTVPPPKRAPTPLWPCALANMGKYLMTSISGVSPLCQSSCLPFVRLSVCSSVRTSVRPYVRPSVRPLSVNLSVHCPFICPYICPSNYIMFKFTLIRPFIFLSMWPSIHLLICPFISPSLSYIILPLSPTRELRVPWRPTTRELMAP